ncbi:MAG: SsrA-binding protein SmpB [Chlamydiae bacterium]|nr:SsrA-binding protein SmpB [Chlamydiota bacterium]
MEKEIATNRQAFYNYEILDTFEAGIALRGTEVKSLRNGKCTIAESYVDLDNSLPVIKLMSIPPYAYGNIHNHEEKRVRKLLLHKEEILRIQKMIEQKGYTAIPLSIYFKKGLVKLRIGIGKGKKLHDKRGVIKERELSREAQRAMKNS